jgi:hypothetical protein
VGSYERSYTTPCPRLDFASALMQTQLGLCRVPVGEAWTESFCVLCITLSQTLFPSLLLPKPVPLGSANRNKKQMEVAADAHWDVVAIDMLPVLLFIPTVNPHTHQLSKLAKSNSMLHAGLVGA